jgi:hypothetical protein
MADDVGVTRQSGRTATKGNVEVMSRGQVMGCARWATAFAGKHKDHRYYELVEDTIQPDFAFRYFAIKDEDGSVCAVQPFFIIDQDLLLGTDTRLWRVISFIRRSWPRFMKMRALMVGCGAGEGHLAAPSNCVPLPAMPSKSLPCEIRRRDNQQRMSGKDVMTINRRELQLIQTVCRL